MGTRLSSHISQVVSAQRFQPYIDDFSTTQVSEQYDLESISTIPISLIVADGDEVCLPAQAETLGGRLKTLDDYVDVVGDHEYFYENNSAEYLKVLSDQLEMLATEDDGATKLTSATALLTLFATAALFLQ